MAARLNVSMKHVQIDKANSVVVAAVAAAAFVLVFAGFAARSLIEIRNYQARVIEQKLEARDDIRLSLEGAQQLQSTYNAFVAQPQNIIGGNSNAAGERDGDNGRIVLDALPSSYDFPALITSLEKIMSTQNVTIGSITGNDEELMQSGVGEPGVTGEVGATEGAVVADAPVVMPFSVTVSGNYQAIQDLVSVFERSIRPFHPLSLTLGGSEDNMTLSVEYKTYYQPETLFQVRKEVVK
jgi:hypothetical protein